MDRANDEDEDTKKTAPPQRRERYATRTPLVDTASGQQRVRATQCRACGAWIWWGLTRSDKPIPFDCWSADRGPWVVDGWQHTTRAPLVRPVEPLLDESHVPRWRPHWATCPHADAMRKGGRK